MGRFDEARTEFERAAALALNPREREILVERAGAVDAKASRAIDFRAGEAINEPAVKEPIKLERCG